MGTYSKAMTASALGQGIQGIGAALLNISSDRQRQEREAAEDARRDRQEAAQGEYYADQISHRDRVFDTGERRYHDERQQNQINMRTQDRRSGYDDGVMIEPVREMPGMTDPSSGASFEGKAVERPQSGTYMPGTTYNPESDSRLAAAREMGEIDFGFTERGARLTSSLADGRDASAVTRRENAARANPPAPSAADQRRASNQAQLLLRRFASRPEPAQRGDPPPKPVIDWEGAFEAAGDNPLLIDALQAVQAQLSSSDLGLPGAQRPPAEADDWGAKYGLPPEGSDGGASPQSFGFGIDPGIPMGGSQPPSGGLNEQRQMYDAAAATFASPEEAARALGPRP